MVDTAPDSKVHEANMGPTRVLSDLDGPHVGLMNLAIRSVPWGLQVTLRSHQIDVLLTATRGIHGIGRLLHIEILSVQSLITLQPTNRLIRWIIPRVFCFICLFHELDYESSIVCFHLNSRNTLWHEYSILQAWGQNAGHHIALM